MDLDSSQTWYTRAAVTRGIAALEESISTCERLIAQSEKDGTIEWAVDSLRSATHYNRQLLQEIEQYVPKDFR